MMDAKQRCWLVAEAPDKGGQLASEVEALGWELTPLPLTDSSVHPGADKCPVGLIFLAGMTQPRLDQLESMMLQAHCLWLAVLPGGAAADDGQRHLITTLCHSFVEAAVGGHQLDWLLQRSAALAQLQQQDREFHRSAAALSTDTGEYEMVGTSPAMRTLFQNIRKVAAVDASVFISGESGTGKELTALAIHERSPRASRTFHAINCGALPEQLIQSELFGHEKGAFTGAAQRKVGRIEAADAGTLFLDEIGDLPLEQQVNLLRFLETQRIRRVGGLEEISVDVRILAATHIDLEKAVSEGRFREDLYHRLNVLQVTVPALREHPEDIEILARYFFERFSSEKPGRLKGFSCEALQAMRHYHWPGNIRELLNRIRRAMVMCDNRLIQPEDLGIGHSERAPVSQTLCQARDQAEREALASALQRNGHKVHPAARELGVSRVTIYRLMEKHGLCRAASATPA
ncbi:MAG: sigma-54 dependent transcriptional regulator [Halomonas sp.]|nr:sigma-54 dependent transcriptional regulator [Halomonas sp.]MDN6297980.1 sigma-54 dependent transcriptional regulator [Halomonas sp.]MDN6315225.1 sigma-54 dependent transcriptional regulator [Halomonas sp.]MDN6336987.1 sigma-54 dependent transcriptional regulator [Halomonas sp.]